MDRRTPVFTRSTCSPSTTQTRIFAQYGTKSGGHAGRRRKGKRELKRKSGATALTSDAAAASPIGSDEHVVEVSPALESEDGRLSKLSTSVQHSC